MKTKQIDKFTFEHSHGGKIKRYKCRTCQRTYLSNMCFHTFNNLPKCNHCMKGFSEEELKNEFGENIGEEVEMENITEKNIDFVDKALIKLKNSGRNKITWDEFIKICKNSQRK